MRSALGFLAGVFKSDFLDGRTEILDESQPFSMSWRCQEVSLEPPTVLYRERALEIRVDQVVSGCLHILFQAFLGEDSFFRLTPLTLRQAPEEEVDQRSFVRRCGIHWRIAILAWLVIADPTPALPDTRSDGDVPRGVES